MYSMDCMHVYLQCKRRHRRHVSHGMLVLYSIGWGNTSRGNVFSYDCDMWGMCTINQVVRGNLEHFNVSVSQMSYTTTTTATTAAATCCSSNPNTSPTASNVLVLSAIVSKLPLQQLLTYNNPVMNELYQTIWHTPKVVSRLVSEIVSHLVLGQPKRPHWNIQQTVVMSFLQVLRDHSLANSLEFWRLLLIAPTWLTPLTSKTQDGSFRVRRRFLRGVLSDLDAQEQGRRILSVEWMSAGSIWDRCQSVINPTCDGRDDDDNAAADDDTSTMQKSNALVLRTRSPEKIVLYLHGGAYCAMSAQTHRTLTHKISKATGRRVFGKVFISRP